MSPYLFFPRTQGFLQENQQYAPDIASLTNQSSQWKIVKKVREDLPNISVTIPVICHEKRAISDICKKLAKFTKVLHDSVLSMSNH